MTLTNNLTQIMPMLLNAVIDSEMDVMCVCDMECGMSTCTDDVVSLQSKRGATTRKNSPGGRNLII